MAVVKSLFKRTFDSRINAPRFQTERHYLPAEDDRIEAELSQMCIESSAGIYYLHEDSSLTVVGVSAQDPIQNLKYEKTVFVQTSGNKSETQSNKLAHPEGLLRLLEKHDYHFEPKRQSPAD
jgi:hypothetical protein